jgi:hypothetical protein
VKALERAHRQCLARELVTDGQMKPLLESLRARGIPFLLMKGAALRRLGVYRPGTRPMNDVDVLVSPRRWHDALTAAQVLGARELWPAHRPLTRHFFHESDQVLPGGVAVDLHRNVAAWPLFRFSTDELLSRANHEVPARDDLLVMLAVHAAQDGFSLPLRAVVDGLLLARTVEPSSVVRRAVRFGARRATAAWLRVLVSFGAAPGWATAARELSPATARYRPITEDQVIPRRATTLRLLLSLDSATRGAAFLAARAALRVGDLVTACV